MNALVKFNEPLTAIEQLSNRDRALLEEFFLARTQTDAARKLFPNAKRPDVLMSKWKAKPMVKRAIEERRADILEAVGISPEQIVRELAVIAFGDTRELFDADGNLKPMNELTIEQAALVASIDSETTMLGVGKQTDLFAGADDVKAAAVKVRRKVKRWDKVAALRELKEIAGLNKNDADTGRPFNLIINV